MKQVFILGDNENLISKFCEAVSEQSIITQKLLTFQIYTNLNNHIAKSESYRYRREYQCQLNDKELTVICFIKNSENFDNYDQFVIQIFSKHRDSIFQIIEKEDEEFIQVHKKQLTLITVNEKSFKQILQNIINRFELIEKFHQIFESTWSELKNDSINVKILIQQLKKNEIVNKFTHQFLKSNIIQKHFWKYYLDIQKKILETIYQNYKDIKNLKETQLYFCKRCNLMFIMSKDSNQLEILVEETSEQLQNLTRSCYPKSNCNICAKDLQKIKFDSFFSYLFNQFYQEILDKLQEHIQHTSELIIDKIQHKEDSIINCQDNQLNLSSKINDQNQEIKTELTWKNQENLLHQSQSVKYDYEEKFNQQYLSVLFLAYDGQEKTSIFNKLDLQGQEIQLGFQKSQVIKNRYIFHNPIHFCFQSCFSEEVEKFRQYFSNNSIHFFFLLVNFSRYNEMKNKLTEMIKRIPNLNRESIAMIVTSWNADEEKAEEIRNFFKYFKFKMILFFEQNIQKEDILDQFSKCLNDTEPIPFNFQGTIFQSEKTELLEEITQGILTSQKRVEDLQREAVNNQIQICEDQIQELKRENENFDLQIQYLMQQKKENQNKISKLYEIKRKEIQALKSKQNVDRRKKMYGTI